MRLSQRLLPHLAPVILAILGFLAILSFGLLGCPAAAATLGVPSQYATVQSAVNAAQNGDTVLIADGTYTGPGNVDIDFTGKNITVTSQNGAATTIIDCGGSSATPHRGFVLQSGETSAVLRGLTVENGYIFANGGGGGAVSCEGVGVTVQGCIFKNNVVLGGSGGGVYSYTQTSTQATLVNCVFSGNSAIYGGGFFAGSINSQIPVTNCTFTGNTATNSGGGGGICYANVGYPSGTGSILLTNDILYGDANGEVITGPGTAYAANCDISGGFTGSNISTDPLFVNAASNLHLRFSSPCLGAGTAAGAPVLALDGQARPNPPSIGAYEVNGPRNVPGQYATIQAAINASVSGDTVLIADGSYTGPGNVDLDFGGKSIIVTSQHGAASTIIDCQGSRTAYHRGFYLHSGEINAGISGLTIQNGYEGPNAGDGGGIWDFQAGLSVQNCVLRNNFCAGGGGGIASFVEYNRSAIITNCVIVNNSAGNGGGMENYSDGGGVITVTNCTVTGNSTGNGTSSGLYDLGSAVNLINDIVYANPGTNIASYNSSSSAITSHCDIQGGLPSGVTDSGGNISADPLFLSSSNLHLPLGSPCLGAGTASYVTYPPATASAPVTVYTPTTTADGRTRPNPPSIGAYEQAQAVITLMSSLNPSVISRSVTFTASVNSDGGAATGTVIFTVDGTAQPPVPLGHFGTIVGMASYTTSYLSIGSHTVSAAYSGDSKFSPSATAVLTEIVNAHLSPQYVSPSGSDSNSGTQAAPKLTIQAALNACLSGDVVLIGDGTYTGPGNVDLTLGGQNIAVDSLNGPFTTIIDCAGSSSANHRGFLLNAETRTFIGYLTIENGYESGGSAYGTGGAILNYSSGLTLQNCILKNNTATSGGGLYSSASGGPVMLSNCVVSGNATLPYVSGSVSSGGSGGGIENISANGSAFTMVECTVTGNAAVNGGSGGGIDSFTSGGGTATLTNSIFYGDTGGEVFNEGNTSSSVAGTYCDVQGGYAGTGNINADPLFTSSSDLHLGLSSPCLGAGTESSTTSYAIDRRTRPNPPSIGAFEGFPITTSLAVAHTSGVAGQTATLSATLSRPDGVGIAGKTISFFVSGDGSSANSTTVTGSTGVATLSYAVPAGIAAGDHTVTASFSGDGSNNASYGTGTLTVSAPPVNQVRFAPRPSYGYRMVGGIFQGSHDGTTYTTLATVTQAPPDNQYSTLPTSADPATFRFLRYLAPDGTYGNIAELEFDSSSVKLTGTGFGTPGSYYGNGYDFTKALDGSTSSYFDAPYPGNGDFVGIDQGAPNTGGVRFAPRPGYGYRMVGGIFQGSHDGTAYTTLATVTQAPPDSQYSTLPTSADPAGFRFLRYLAPDGTYGNVAEVEFDSKGAKLTGTGFGTAGSYYGSGSDFTKALDGSVSSYFDAPYPGNGDFVGVDQGAPAAPTSGQVRFAPRPGFGYRMVGGIFQGSHDGTTYTTLATVGQTPPDNQYSTLPTAVNPSTFRFLRYLAPDGTYSNVAELEFDSDTLAPATKVTGTPFGTAGSYYGSGSDFTKAFDSNVGTYFDAPYPGNGDYAGIDQGAGK